MRFRQRSFTTSKYVTQVVDFDSWLNDTNIVCLSEGFANHIHALDDGEKHCAHAKRMTRAVKNGWSGFQCTLSYHLLQERANGRIVGRRMGFQRH
jgi:hypothetical protein